MFFLAAHLNISGELKNYASYVASWKKHLDEKDITRAATVAAKVFEWILK